MTAFDRLFVRGRDAVLSGAHVRDVPPVDGGRWGMSVVLVPDRSTRTALAAATADALAVAGDDHWPTGTPHAVHVTVRAIEPYRTTPPGDLADRCARALARAAAASGPVGLTFRGLTLTPSGVMACAFPADGAADHFADRLAHELGPDGWFEAAFRRDIRYATLVHFTGDIRDPHALVRFVAERRRRPFGRATIGAAELLRFRYDGRQPVRHRLAAADLTSGAG
ncbi:hypothetical protein [Virgisporangium ochraceum]|uniref:2'-5' RNA ligase n=1 Tax=Virgisporangium ochraceum TaxID=65505 RepID=A0A8J4EDS1_9ACTN|nr:hypothetical protein [Virgisporangium ochraceum]GIJ70976.1 hypothetical protein Voc01_058930 [Virgisporangium ochraceum]